jgi:hypothetical protein
MSDYSPDPRRPDPYGTAPRYQYTEVREGRSTYAVVALLSIAALVGGVLMFSGSQQPADQQAQVPPTPMTTPAPTPVAPAPVAPATPANTQQ